MTNPNASKVPKFTFEEAKAVLEVSGIPVCKADYVSLSDIVPAEFDWFWDMIECNPTPFSFGDNNFSMVTGDRFAVWLIEIFEYWNNTEEESEVNKEEWDKFIGNIWMCNDAGIFIDLET